MFRILCSLNMHIILGALIVQMDLGNARISSQSCSLSRTPNSHLFQSLTTPQIHHFQSPNSPSLMENIIQDPSCSLAKPENIEDDDEEEKNETDEVEKQLLILNKFSKSNCATLPSRSTNLDWIHSKCNNDPRRHTIHTGLQSDAIYLECFPHHLDRPKLTSNCQTPSIIQSNWTVDHPCADNLVDDEHVRLRNVDRSDGLVFDLGKDRERMFFSSGLSYPRINSYNNNYYCSSLFKRIGQMHRKLQ